MIWSLLIPVCWRIPPIASLIDARRSPRCSEISICNFQQNDVITLRKCYSALLLRTLNGPSIFSFLLHFTLRFGNATHDIVDANEEAERGKIYPCITGYEPCECKHIYARYIVNEYRPSPHLLQYRVPREDHRVRLFVCLSFLLATCTKHNAAGSQPRRPLDFLSGWNSPWDHYINTQWLDIHKHHSEWLCDMWL